MFSKLKNNGANTAELSNVAAAKKKELDEIAVETLRRVIDTVDDSLELDKLDGFQRKQFSEQIYDTLVQFLEEEERQLSQADKQKVISYVSDEIFGYGPINSLINDPTVTEIMINGFDNVYVEREGKLIKTDVTFRDNAHLSHTINKIINPLGRRIDESCPTVDARLPDGSRVNAIIPPLSLKGPAMTIRKFSVDPFTVEDLVNFGTMSAEIASFLQASVRARVNIIVSGGTGSGKTTTLNVLSSFIPESDRIITIEDTAELQMKQDHVVTLESRPANIEGKGQFTIRELVINSLRMRPDRIVVGEVRGGEALDMLQAMNTGHDGSISTLHANNPRDAISRLETMVLMAGMEIPLTAIREQISSAIDLIIHQSRFKDGTRKITRIAEVVGMEGNTITLQDVFVFKQSSINEKGYVLGRHVPTGVVPFCMEKLNDYGESFCFEELSGWKQGIETHPPSPSQVEEREQPGKDDFPAEGSADSQDTAVAGQEEALPQFAAVDGDEEEEDARPEDEETALPGEDAEMSAWSGKVKLLPLRDKETSPEESRTALELASAAPEEKNAAGDVPQPTLELFTQAPFFAESGQEVSFSIHVSNSGDVDLYDVKLADEALDWNARVEMLPAGQLRRFEVDCYISGSGTESFEGTTLASAADRGGRKVECEYSYCLPVLGPVLDLEVAPPPVAKPGSKTGFTVTVTNSSKQVDLFNVRVYDSLSGWEGSLAELPAGEVYVFEVQHELPDTGQSQLSSVTRASGESRYGEAAFAETSWSVTVESPSQERQPEPLQETGQAPPPGEHPEAAFQKLPRVPRGKRGISIPVNDAAALSWSIKTGDRVDVLVTCSGDESSTSTVEDALVLAVGKGDGYREGTGMVTLAVEPEQARILALAYQRCFFYLLMRPSGE